jgi:hypothetical protein
MNRCRISDRTQKRELRKDWNPLDEPIIRQTRSGQYEYGGRMAQRLDENVRMQLTATHAKDVCYLVSLFTEPQHGSS